jgi:outer membrane protein assembly factor BamB
VIDQAANPAVCRGTTGGLPCTELTVESFAHAGLPAPATGAPVVVANAGATGAVNWEWDGVDASGNVLGLRYGPPAFPGPLLATGRAAAWAGSVTGFQPGDLDAFQTTLALGLVSDGMRLGDAYQRAAADLARGSSYDPRAFGTVLFGDPARSYWGGGLDGLAPWPGDGGGRGATGASAYNGPAIPAQAWVLRDTAVGTAPVIGRHGELIVAGSGRIARAAGAGAIVAQNGLPGTVGAARYPAALTVDRVWLAVGGTLQVLDPDLATRTEVRLPNGAAVTGGPRPGGDGRVYVPTQQGLARVDGSGRAELVATEGVRGTPALRRTGEVVWSTEQGTVLGLRVHQDGRAVKRNLVARNLGTLTAPVVSPADTVYVGSSDGRVYALPDGGATPWQLEAGGAVRLRPAVATDGTVYVVNAQGQLLAFAAEQREQLWRVSLGAAASASPAVDAGTVFVTTGRTLWALARATGQVFWSLDLGGATDERATPVIGPDRTLYVTRADQALVAVREAGWLAAPSAVDLESATGGFVVHWRDNSADEQGFRVEGCTLDEHCEVMGTTAPNATRLEVRRIPFGDTLVYYAKVAAVGLADSGDGQLEATAWASSEPALSAPRAALPDPPAAATGLRVAATASDSATLTWEYDGVLAALLGFTVSREDADGTRIVAVLGADARRFTDPQLRPEHGYTYVVTAFGPAGSAAATRGTVTTLRQTLRAPTELTATSERVGVQLRWRDVNSSETGVRVERLDPGLATYQPLAQLGANATAFLDHYQLVPGTYTYRIRVVGEAVDSAASIVTVRYGGAPGKAVYLPVAYQRRR